MPGMNAILGANGSGKTNVVNGIFFALVGSTFSDGGIEQNIRFGADSASVSLWFALDRVDGKITRTLAKTRGRATHSAELEYGSMVVTGAKAVNEAVQKLLGARSGLITNHVFVPADSLNTLLFGSQTDRLKGFLSLLPDSAEAEKIRARVYDELYATPAVELTIDADGVRRQIELKQSEISDLHRAIASIESIRAQLHDPSQELTQYTTNKQLHQVMLARLRELHISRAAAKNELDDEKDRQVKRYREAVNKLAEYTALLGSIKAELSDATGKLSALGNDIELASLAATKISAKETLASAVLKGVVETCALCGNRTTNEQIASNRDANAAAKLAAENVRLATLKSSKAKLETAISSLIAKEARATEQLKAVVTLVTELDTRRESGSFGQAADAIGLRILDLEREYSEVSTRVNELKRWVGEDADAKIETLCGIKRKRDELNDSMSLLRGRLGAEESALSKLQELLKSIETSEAKAEAVKRYRRLLSTAYDLLKRDMLPKRSLETYTSSFESAINKFLTMFSAPFCISVSTDMDMTCRINDKTLPIYRLSNGQKGVLSVCARFALADMFLRSINLMGLDEPTQNMDTDNVRLLAAMMSEFSTRLSMGQILLITHHADEMRPMFDHIIQL